MKATPASEFKTANRKEVTLPSGRTVVIRKLTAEFLWVIRDLFEKYLAAGEGAATFKFPMADQRRYIEALVCEAVVQPRVVPTTQEPGDDEMWTADFGQDLDTLFGAINEFNEGIIAAPFRPVADGGAPPPGSEGVPGAPVGPAERAPAGPDV